MDKEDWLSRDGDQFQLHQIDNHSIFLRFHVYILIGTVHIQQNQKLRSSYMIKRPGPVFLA